MSTDVRSLADNPSTLDALSAAAGDKSCGGAAHGPGSGPPEHARLKLLPLERRPGVPASKRLPTELGLGQQWDHRSMRPAQIDGSSVHAAPRAGRAIRPRVARRRWYVVSGGFRGGRRRYGGAGFFG
jgi:hypothetical protein